LNKEIITITDAVNNQIWEHVKAIADLTGPRLKTNRAHDYPESKEELPAMVNAFELLALLKEVVNQVDIHLNNLGHDLNPEYYKEIKKDEEPG